MSAEPSDRAHQRSPFIATAPARAALVPLEQGLGARAPLVLLMGDAGTGRSMLAREALRRRGERVAPVLFPDPAPPPAELLATLLVLYGGTPKPGAMAFALTERLMDTLANATAAGRVAVALIDDAERLTDEHILELDRIAAIAAQRQCPFELLLVGTPKLLARFDAPHMATVRPHVSVRSTLARFSSNDTREYLQSRLNAAGVPCTGMFSRKASRDIHQISVGVVRVIEALAAESLRRATRAGSGTVSPEHVRAADHALRTGRPSNATDAAPTSQVRAGAVDMAANTRSVPHAAEPKHAPSQGVRPMGQSASARFASQPAPTPPNTPTAATPQPSSATPTMHMQSPAPRSLRQPPTPSPATSHAAPAPSQAAASNSTPPAAPHAAPTRSTGDGFKPPITTRPATPAHDPGSIGAYPSSDDPRVQEWIARFGGKGVRVGAASPTSISAQDYADFGSNRMADADGVVSPARPIRRAPEAAIAPAPGTAIAPHGANTGANPQPTPHIAPAAPEPTAPAASQPRVAPPIASQPAPAQPAAPRPVLSRREAKRLARANAQASAHAPTSRKVASTAAMQAVPAAAPEPIVAATTAAAPPRDNTTRPHLTPATRASSRPKPPAHSGVLVGLVALAALLAIGFSQRHAIDAAFTQAFAHASPSKPATVSAAPAPVPPPLPAPPAQYSIAVGSYATRDMASAECDYLTRLVPMRVRVNGLGGGLGYRLLLGRFDARVDAELAIQRLQDQGLIPDARAIEIAPFPAAANAVTESLGTSAPDSAPALSLEPAQTPKHVPPPEKPVRQRARRRR